MKMPPAMPKLNEEQRVHQSSRDWWNIFAGFVIGAIPAFILGFELAR